jgi:ABC-type transporter Mla MlaB component
LQLGPTFALLQAEGRDQVTLRIQKSAERNSTVLTLIGRIQSDQVFQLRNLLDSVPPDSIVTLDLADVRLVDRDAVRFLAEQEAAGTVLRNCSAYIREWISQERIGLQPPETQNARKPGEMKE